MVPEILDTRFTLLSAFCFKKSEFYRKFIVSQAFEVSFCGQTILDPLLDVRFDLGILVLINPCELSEAEGPPTGMQVLQLQEERKLSAQEIRRLSPCATFYRSLIGVRWDPEEGFWTWGILNSGTRWVARIDGGRLQSSAAPDRVIINVSGPGNLIISR